MFDDIFNLLWDDKNRYLINDKKHRTRDLVLYMLNRTQQIFIWENLPDTIPQHNLENLLQTCGNVCITEVTDVPTDRGQSGLYAFFGGLGGIQNAYYEPTIYTIANPYFEFNKELKIGTDCVRARNDLHGIGLLPMFIKYGAMMNENEVSLNMLSISYRINELISADDDRTFESAKEFLNQIIDGNFGAISSSEFFDGIRNDKASATGHRITDLIEYEQYLKASWFNEIGLNSNYNMKRERIVSAEAELTDDALIPLVDNMLSWRLKACEEIKELYGDKYDLDGLTVELNAVWDLDRMFITTIPESSAHPDAEETEEKDDLENDTFTDAINDDSNISDTLDSITEETETTETETEETPDADINININISTETDENTETETEETETEDNEDAEL